MEETLVTTAQVSNSITKRGSEFLSEDTQLLKLIFAPNSILHQPGEIVTEFDTESLKYFVGSMMTTMTKYKAFGLAAPQVGRSEKIITYAVDREAGYMINPTITDRSPDMKNQEEWCLSFPGIGITTSRNEAIVVEYQTINGTKCTQRYGGTLSIVIQHEIDHIRGITFDSYLSRLKRDIVIRKLTKLQKKMDIHNERAHILRGL